MGKASVGPTTHDIAAYDLYLKARHEEALMTREHFDNAIGSYRAAIDRDPSFAEAYAGLAETYSLMDHRPGLTNLEPKESYALAVQAAEKALSLDPDSVEAHTAVGHIDMHLGHFGEAESHLNRALQLNPNFSTALLWHGVLLRTLGHSAQSREQFVRAMRLDPRSDFIPVFVSANAWGTGDFQLAREAAVRGIEIEPHGAQLHVRLAEADAALGRYSDADAALLRAEQLGAENADADRAMFLAFQGRRAEAAILLRRLAPEARGPSLVRMLRAWAAVGDSDQFAYWLNRVVTETPDYGRIAVDIPPHPAFVKFRDDPRYLEARRKLGLPPPENAVRNTPAALTR
jgi:tetratricopeptide (TPR) repeat protein